MAQKTRVGLIFGGRSAEHEVSLASAASVYKNLDPGKYDVLCLLIQKDGLWQTVAAPGENGIRRTPSGNPALSFPGAMA